eukprot:2481090-Pleurochrysis_carterae.AAC.1
MRTAGSIYTLSFMRRDTRWTPTSSSTLVAIPTKYIFCPSLTFPQYIPSSHLTQEGLITVVERMSLLDVLSNSAAPKERLCMNVNNAADVQERTAKAMAEFAKYRARDGIFTKQSMLSNAKNNGARQLVGNLW